MIKRYFDFVNESVELILESDVVYSKMFRTALTKIDNPISKILLDVENKDLPVSSNYFDIAKGKNDHLSVIPDRKAKEILGDTKEMVRFTGSGGGWLKHSEANESIFSKLGYVPEGEAYQPNSSEVGEIVSKITSETSGKVWCYVKFTSGKGVYNQEKLRVVDERLKEVWIKNRQEVRIGRAIRALLNVAGENILDKDLEVFVNQWKATIDKMNDRFQYFDVVDGEDIGHWYHYSNYKERSGSLGSSCMSNVNTNYFDIYIKNVDVCKLIILRSIEDDTKIMGRALLWTLSDGKKFVDRIYTIQDSDVQLFRDYAKENGWYTKQYNSSSDSGRAIAPDGSLVDLGTITVDIISGMYEAYPYLDTLKYFKPREGTLSNVRTGRGDEYTLEDTSGELWRCEYCGGSGEQTCGNCDGDGSWECGNCDGEGTIDCSDCSGSGEAECSECDGSGKNGEEDCDDCSGSGKVSCDSCDGDGTNQCRRCDGDGREECDDCGGRGEHSCYECQ
jgi:hypothetical protein